MDDQNLGFEVQVGSSHFYLSTDLASWHVMKTFCRKGATGIMRRMGVFCLFVCF